MSQCIDDALDLTVGGGIYPEPACRKKMAKDILTTPASHGRLQIVILSSPMNNIMKSSTGSSWFAQNPNARTKCASPIFPLLALTAGLVLAPGPAQAVNLLTNPSFEASPQGHNSPTNVATGWTRFAPPTAQSFGNYWVDHAVSAHSGTYYWKEWGACYDGTNNVAGIYQTFSSTSGSAYQASGWLYINSGDVPSSTNTVIWVQVEFLDSSTNLLALYKSADFNINAPESTWIQYQVTNACDLTQPVPTGDPFFPNIYAITGAVSQMVAPAATASVRYRYCYLQHLNDGGSSYFDDADLEQLTGPIPPVISDLYPQSMIFVAPSNGVSFNVSSPSGHNINTSAIHLVLNGSDVSGGLAFSGSSSNWAVFYNGLQSNTAYNVSITATDSFNFTASANTIFQTTWVGVPPPTYLWEAEDWDFSSGTYVNFPDLCNACCETNCYFGQVGVEGTDENNVSYASGPQYHVYRPDDFEGTQPSEDYSRPNLFVADRIDYCINPFNYTEWVNYTRDWPNSTNWIIGRFANGAISPGGLSVSVINPGVSTNLVGYFVMNPGPSWSTFQFVYLQDTNLDGQNANVVLNGTETLQVTASVPGGGGNMLPTFYMLVPAQPDLPFLSKLYPTGKHPFEHTNALSFTVTTLGATFPANGIQVILDGNNVSSNLVITGTASSNTVVYPALPPNETHTAIITVTNSLGHGIGVTNQFDTFTQNNYMVEAEDFDYSGGQYVSAADYYPDVYGKLNLNVGSVADVDFQHTSVSGEPTDGSEYNYRSNGIPQQVAQDYLRQIYIDNFASDYQLYWFGGGDWANYTRAYPTGSFFAYARSSGLGSYTMTLSRVVSGAGTTNQATTPIGQWSATGDNINTFGWVPLTDAGLVAPVIVKLGGVSTLQVSTPTGNCYPDYFMLVPASGINPSAAKSGNNINISFPTQAGGNYRVFYRTNLTAGNWILLTSVPGDGTVKTVTDPGSAGNQRFYKVTSP